jgi:hypothetical protein
MPVSGQKIANAAQHSTAQHSTAKHGGANRDRMPWRRSHTEGYPTSASRGIPIAASDPGRPVACSQRAADVGLGSDEFGSLKC